MFPLCSPFPHTTPICVLCVVHTLLPSNSSLIHYAIFEFKLDRRLPLEFSSFPFHQVMIRDAPLRRGCTVAYEKGFKDFIVKSDSTEAVTLLKDGPSTRTPLRSLVEDARFLMRRCNGTIQYTMREGNGCADHLANMGANQDEMLAVINDPPEDLKARLIAEMLGVEYRRP